MQAGCAAAGGEPQETHTHLPLSPSLSLSLHSPVHQGNVRRAVQALGDGDASLAAPNDDDPGFGWHMVACADVKRGPRMKKKRSESGRGGVRSVGECCRHTCDGEREHASRARQTPTHPRTRHTTMPPTPPDGVSPPPTRPGARAVRGTLGEGGGPAAAAALPARAARPHGSAGEAAGPRPSSTHSAHDVERGAAAFEEECFADGMPVVFQVCGGSERVRKRASLERAGVGWHALPLWPRPRPRAMHVASDSVLVGRAWQTCWLVLVAPRRTMRPASPSPGAARVLFQRAAPAPALFFF